MAADEPNMTAQRDRLARLFQATPVPLFVLDADQHILHANRRARHTVGRSEPALRGAAFIEFIDPAWRHSLQQRLESVAEGGPARTADTGLLTSDGKTLFARVEAIPVHEPEGLVILVAVLVLTEDTANLHLVGDTFDTTRDRVRDHSEAYERGQDDRG